MMGETLPAKSNGSEPPVPGGSLVRGDFVPHGPVPEDATEIRSEVTRLRGAINSAYGRLGQLLHEVQSQQLYAEWGYGSFGEYGEKEIGWGRRKCEYLASIYKKLVLGAKVDVNDLEGVEWSKAREIARVANPENVEEWITRAKESTTDQLKNAVRAEKQSQADRLANEGVGNGPIPEGGETPPPAPAEPVIRLNVSLYEGQYENCMAAFAAAEQVTGSDARNHHLDTICLEYLATHTQGQPKARLQWMMNQLEKAFPVRLFAVPGDLTDDEMGLIDEALKSVTAARAKRRSS